MEAEQGLGIVSMIGDQEWDWIATQAKLKAPGSLPVKCFLGV